MIQHNKKYDVIVVGAGHSGIESALAVARMCCKTVIFTLNLDNIVRCHVTLLLVEWQKGI